MNTAARDAIVGVARERYSWEGVASTVAAAAQGRLDDLFAYPIEGGWIDVTLLRQDGLQCAYAQLRVGELRAVLMLIVLGHRTPVHCSIGRIVQYPLRRE